MHVVEIKNLGQKSVSILIYERPKSPIFPGYGLVKLSRMGSIVVEYDRVDLEILLKKKNIRIWHSTRYVPPAGRELYVTSSKNT
jgi:hypothetical protein